VGNRNSFGVYDNLISFVDSSIVLESRQIRLAATV